jgi:hypothetical protein
MFLINRFRRKRNELATAAEKNGLQRCSVTTVGFDRAVEREWLLRS